MKIELIESPSSVEEPPSINFKEQINELEELIYNLNFKQDEINKIIIKLKNKVKHIKKEYK